jgi:hypothetical protein
MKKSNILLFVIVSFFSLPVLSQSNNEPVALGLPGDNLNLYAVLEVFQKSPTLEDFEKSLNDKETKINNLDLNNDKLVDYIQVVNFKEGNSHSVVLRVAVNENENQDVAVIEVNKNTDGNIVIQLIGDEYLYGKDYIVEPSNNQVAEGTPNPGYIENIGVVYYANSWPVVSYLYSPGFVMYISPWYWGYYPSYWYPWTPIFYYDYWSFNSFYYTSTFYRRVSIIRYPVHYSSYTRVRNTSAVIVQNKNNGNYNATYDSRVYRKPEGTVTRPITTPTGQKQTVQPSSKPTINSPRPTTQPKKSNSSTTKRKGN